jgi:hemolysin III
VIKRQKTIAEEIANSITHGIGLFFSIAGLGIIVTLASVYGETRHIVSCSIFGATLVVLYTASTLYHAFQNPKVKHIFKIVDHCAIYLLIAGTYTPFTLVSLRGNWGWALFGVIWGLTLFGILFKIFFINRLEVISTLVYLSMGWLALIAINPILTQVPISGVLWLVAGGLAYTFGVIFYFFDRIPYYHTIWHLFVLAGSLCHYFAVIQTILHPVRI